MAAIEFNLTGDRAMIKRMGEAARRHNRAMKVGTYAIGIKIMRGSKKIVPFEDWVLHDSGYVTMPIESNNVVRVEMGYGGPAEDYTVVQHEEPDFRHAPGRRWHYLVDPFNKATSDMRAFTKIFSKAFDKNQTVRRVSDVATHPDQGASSGQ